MRYIFRRHILILQLVFDVQPRRNRAYLPVPAAKSFSYFPYLCRLLRCWQSRKRPDNNPRLPANSLAYNHCRCVHLVVWAFYFFAVHYKFFLSKRLFVTAIGNSSISLAQRQLPAPLICSQISGKPPIPSNRLAIVASRSY